MQNCISSDSENMFPSYKYDPPKMLSSADVFLSVVLILLVVFILLVVLILVLVLILIVLVLILVVHGFPSHNFISG